MSDEKSAKRARVTKEPKSSPSERLSLATAIASITRKGDEWVAALEAFKTLRENIIQNLETEISTLQRSKEETEALFEQTKRARQIEMDQDLSEYGYQQALKILSDRKEVAVSQDQLQSLQQELSTLKAKDSSELKTAVENEQKAAAKAFAFEKRALQLQHEKEVAQLTAQNEALISSVENLKRDVEKAQVRLEQAQDLTRHVAEAAKAPPIVQNLGK